MPACLDSTSTGRVAPAHRIEPQSILSMNMNSIARPRPLGLGPQSSSSSSGNMFLPCLR